MGPQPSPKSFSCIPCAQRKVRCDRGEPCSHCKRRRGDVCEYPIPRSPFSHLQSTSGRRNPRVLTVADPGHGGVVNSSRPSPIVPAILGGKPWPAQSLPPRPRSSETLNPNLSTPNQGRKRDYNGTLRPDATTSSSSQVGLVELTDQPTYIEAYVLQHPNFARYIH
jgi:Fungal Zn(2)-Cys(6) binuclear cluster domain